MLVNNQWIIEEIKGRIKKVIPGDKWKWKHMIQKLWDTAEAIVRGKFTVIQAYLNKQEKSQINNLALDIRQELEK